MKISIEITPVEIEGRIQLNVHYHLEGGGFHISWDRVGDIRQVSKIVFDGINESIFDLAEHKISNCYRVDNPETT